MTILIAPPLSQTPISRHQHDCFELLKPTLRDEKAAAILASAMALAPYLDQLYRKNITLLSTLANGGIETIHATIAEAKDTLRDRLNATTNHDQAMIAIRLFRQQINTAVTISDLLDLAPVSEQMHWLSEAADYASSTLIAWLEHQARASNRLKSNARWCVLAMGKLGSGELNFSSDIDVIILYDCPPDDQESGRVFVDLTRQFTNIMTKPTADGIGWRVDLRLRPNPSVTPVAIRTDNAISYYESLARTWERVAFIRARHIAGDPQLAKEFLSEIEPFIWRRYLDYTVIDDMRMMLQREPKSNDLLGFNVKKGQGGIRSIEFAVHVQQLIAGGREQQLRNRSTVVALEALAEHQWISKDEAMVLITCYYALRRLEHRIQMMHDAHSHQLPRQEEKLTELAQFCGHADNASFRTAIHDLCAQVISNTKGVSQKLGVEPNGNADGQKLTLALLLDQDDDSNAVTLALSDLGFTDVNSIIPTCRNWMAGQIPATQSDRARDILGRILPALLIQISTADNPDQAFHAFVRLVENLPIGVQFFSLLEGNPNIAKVIATVLVASPRMADSLSNHTELVDDLLYEGFWHPIDTDLTRMTSELSSAMKMAKSHEASLDALRVKLRHWRFRVHVHMVTSVIEPSEAGQFLSLIAEAAITAALPIARQRIEDRFGQLKDGALIIVAMGRLGAMEMTSSSDLDLVFIHHTPDGAMTDGDKSIPGSLYFTRIGQEIINILTAPTSEGHAYEVDMRLRPSGKSGPVTIAFDRFASYQMDNAWTWEHMALIRARIITGFQHDDLATQIENCLANVMKIERSKSRVIADARDMRQRIAKHHQPRSGHDLRLITGGLIDLDFFAQMMQLMHPLENGQRLGQATAAIASLGMRQIISAKEADTLAKSCQVLMDLNQMMRLTMISVHEQKPENSLPIPLVERFGIHTVLELDQLVAQHANRIASITDHSLQNVLDQNTEK